MRADKSNYRQSERFRLLRREWEAAYRDKKRATPESAAEFRRYQRIKQRECRARKRAQEAADART